jgi:hypothetical protein
MNPITLLSIPSLGGSLIDLIILVFLLVIGFIILIFIVKLVLLFIPAAIIGFIVWFLTGSLWLAGLAFLIIAVISIARRI